MKEFAQILLKWYDEHGRTQLPWRQTHDPYRIWISEIVLQQTRVAQGYEYYERLTQRFPDVFALARAEEDEVMRLWQGLGYYSRARNLHAAAKAVAEMGQFPTQYDEIRKLKGIGDYTAAAIASFAYGLPHAVVDGNVYRVLSRIFGIDTPIDSTAGKKEFAALAQTLMDQQRAGDYNSAIMDFGALQCTPKGMDCEVCPFAHICIAKAQHRTEELPIKAKKTKVTNRYIVYVYLTDGTYLLLRRRGRGDIWQGLYEPCLMEYDHAPNDQEVMKDIDPWMSRPKASLKTMAKGMKHLLTHRRLWVDCYCIHMDELPQLKGYIKVEAEALGHYAMPKILTALNEAFMHNKATHGL